MDLPERGGATGALWELVPSSTTRVGGVKFKLAAILEGWRDSWSSDIRQITCAPLLKHFE